MATRATSPNEVLPTTVSSRWWVVLSICGCGAYIEVTDGTTPKHLLTELQHRQPSSYEIQVRKTSLQWRHYGRNIVSNHQPHDCLLNRLFRRRSKKTSKLRVTGLCAGNSPGTGEFPAQIASNAENVFIWWRHHGECYWPRMSGAKIHSLKLRRVP